MKTVHLRFCALLAGAVLLASCGGGQTVQSSVQSPEQINRRKTDEMNRSLLSAAAARPADIDEGYRIGAEDLLDIEAYNVEEMKKTVRVNSEGNIALPLVGIINVKGLSTNEAEALISRKLEKYVEETVVTVFVREYKSHRISVAGAVKNPQVFSLTGQRYLLDLIMMAGGLAPEAGSICYVIRPLTKTSASAKAQTLVIDLDDLLNAGNFDLNIPVFAGDVINVPKGGVVFVDGQVRTPGAYTMKSRTTTLSQAIAMAQGTTQVADLADVRIFRDNGKPERDVISTDYEAISKGEKPDITLAENDIIIVPLHGAKNFFVNFINTIRGFVSFGSFY